MKIQVAKNKFPVHEEKRIRDDLKNGYWHEARLGLLDLLDSIIPVYRSFVEVREYLHDVVSYLMNGQYKRCQRAIESAQSLLIQTLSGLDYKDLKYFTDYMNRLVKLVVDVAEHFEKVKLPKLGF